MNVASSESKSTIIISPSTNRPTNKSWLTNGRSLIILAVAMALIIWGNALWLREDKSPPAWDTARYLVNSLEAFDLLRQPSLASLKELYFIRNTVRPSIGLVLPTMPVYLLFGVSDDAATLWTNTLFLAIIIFSVYGIGKRLFDVRVGLLAALLIGLNPEMIRLSRIYWPELGATAYTSLTIYLLVLSDFLRRKDFAFLAGLVMGIGMMERPIFPAVFLAGPLAFAFIGSLVVGRKKDGESLIHRLVHRLLPGAILFTLPVMLIDWPFYHQYGQQMLAYVGGFQKSGTFAPVKDQYSLQSLLWYLTNLKLSVSWPFHILYVAGLIVYIVALAMRRVSATSAILLAWVVVPYVVLSLTASKGFSYLASLYPALALLLAFGLLFIFQKNRVTQLVASVLVIALAILTYWQVGWGHPLSQELAMRLAIDSRSPYRENWRSEEIIAAIDQFLSVDKKVTVGVVSSRSYLAEPPLTYFARRQNPNITVIHVTDPFPTLVNAEFVVVKTGRAAEIDPPRTIEDKNAKLVSDVLKHEDSIFYRTHVRVEQFPLPDGSEAVIYRRRAPSTSDEIKTIGDELIAASDNAAWGEEAANQIETRFQVQMRLGGQLLSENRYREALPFFQQAVNADPKSVDARQGLARILFALGNCDGAVEHQRTAVQLTPSNGTYNLLGNILLECKRYDEAITAYLTAIDLDPQEVSTHFVLAQAYTAKGLREDAIAEFNKTIEMDKAKDFTERAQIFLQQLQTP